MKLVSLENITKYNELLNKKIVRSVNSVKPDENGNVQLGTEKSTFNKVVYDTGYFSIGTDATYNFDLTGTDLENVSKENVNIRLVAKVVTAHNGFEVGDIAQLTTTLDDTATPGVTYDVCTYISGNTLYVYSSAHRNIPIHNGTGWLLKANVQIKAVLTAFVPDDGSILLIAEDQTNTSKLIGLPDGTLTWGDKNIVRSVNGVNADENGNVEFHDYLPLTGGNLTGNLTVQNKNVATEDFVNNLNIIRKNYGNDYYDDSDITSLIYAGNGAGTIRNEIANGNFSRVHPGQTIVGRVTGTTYIVVGCNIYLRRGEPELTQNHIGLMPIQLIGNDGNLLWSGRTWAGSGVNNTNQGYAPWASDNETEGKNQASCYRDSYMAKTVLPKVDNLWLKPDFENQGISVLTFRNVEAFSFDTNATCMSNPNWRGCATSWNWTSRRLVLPSEPEIYGHYQWAGSPWESGSQHTQLPLYRHKEIHKVYPRVDIWLKDSAAAPFACSVSARGYADHSDASVVLRVCPLFLIA